MKSIKIATVLIVFLIFLSYSPKECSAALVVDFYESYAVKDSVEVGRISQVVWIARWQHNEVIVISGITGMVNGHLPLEYSEELGGWVSTDIKFEEDVITYSITSVEADYAVNFVQTTSNITITYYGEIVVQVNGTSSDETQTQSSEQPLYPEVANAIIIIGIVIVIAIIVLLKIDNDIRKNDGVGEYERRQ